MTAHPDPTPPPASTDPYVAKAQQRVLTLAEKRALPPLAAIVRLRQRAHTIRRDGATTIGDKLVLDVVLDLLDVVEQVAGQVGT